MTYESTLAKLKRRSHVKQTHKRKKLKCSMEWEKCFESLDTSQQNNLATILEQFKCCLEKFEKLKTVSDTLLKQLFNPFALYKENTPLYVYTDEEENPSCRLVSCAFGPTFPANKYNAHTNKLDSPNKYYQTVLVLTEAPGTGKTNIAYHLTKTPNQIVLLVTLSLTSLLHSKLTKLKSRKDMDDLAGKFFGNFMAFGCMLYDYAERNNFSNPGTSIIRFLFNGGSTLIGECETFLQDLQPKQLLGKSIYFMMDEVQLFENQNISVPCKDSQREGNAITLYSSCIRKMAPLIMTTTFLQSISSELENLVSNTHGKHSLVYSYDFPQPLPVLHSSQVVPFLRNFISIDDKFSQIWTNVSYFIQGPFRRCEHFLQCFLTNLESNIYNLNYHELIYSTIDNVLSSNREEFIELQKTSDCNISATFHNLAVFREASTHDNLPFSKYLLTKSISYTFDDTHKLYQVIGPIDQQILFNSLKMLAQQSGEDWLTYSYHKLDWYNTGIRAKFIQIILIYYLLNFFTDIVKEFSGSYLMDYSLKASYYVKDIQISNKASNFTDIRGSSLMINAMDTSIPTSIIRNGLRDPTFSEMLIIPNNDNGPDLIGVLVRAFPIDQPYIPLICAATLQNDLSKFKENYKTTDIQRLYYQNSENNQPIQQAVGTITSKNNNMLRILFHPNGEFTTPLQDRIAEYSSNLDTCQKAYSNHAVMNNKGHLIYEISSCNANWKKFTKQMRWLERFISNN